MKPANYAPAYAVACYPMLTEIAREHGYALAVHGSLARDFDLIAVPWTDQAADPEAVVAAIHERTGTRLVGEPTRKPHGRVAWSLSVGFGDCAIDLSFMPLRPAPPSPPAAAREQYANEKED